MDAKKKSLVATEQLRPQVQQQRQVWREAIVPTLNPGSLVFLDEAGCNVDMTPSCGYAPIGERVGDHAPVCRGQNVSILSAMNWDGPVATGTFIGAVNGTKFVRWIKTVLAPRLREGDVLIMDNVSFHKVAAVREALSKVGATALYLPPYSPDLNPIEMMWSKLKTMLRQAKARSVKALRHAIHRLLRKIEPMDAGAWMVHAGY